MTRQPTSVNRQPPAATPLAAYGWVLARMVIGGVLLYAGYMKAVGPAAEFAASIEAYKLLPPDLITPLSLGLPWIEMWIGLFLLTGYYTQAAAGGACVLFLTFMAALGSALVRHLDLYSCGCFGYDSFSPSHTIVADTLLLALSIALSLRAKRHSALELDGWIDKP